jgi:hypothetical protein
MECQTNRMAGYCKRTRLTTCYAVLLVYSIGLKSIIELTRVLFVSSRGIWIISWLQIQRMEISLDDGAKN